ncbi:MAG TPA: DegT/DnrJ/EryC1/StrS family aminotransferase [Anaerolineaceae bacterium]|nr:DegT/DnrJ/EryC1/StrS family aminotransferase [Chloroflexota bacterium]HNY83559.1 DegT/DnrJ/EryC1/StrS family aminotransferase [Anaerolineaceae bacterium]
MEKLAIDGGTPVRTKGPIVETDYYTDEELESVIAVMKSARIRRGTVTNEFEKTIAEKLNVKHAIAVTSGTTTLHIALAAFGIGPGDEVIVSPYTFVASDSCVLEQNAIPIFADVDPVTLTLDPADVERKITKRTKAIIPVSITGLPDNIEPIMDLAKKHNLYVLEDAAQSVGAKYRGRYEGKYVGTVGHVGSFSTVTGKILSTGEGGFVVTNDDDLYEKMWGFMDFGRKKSLGGASKYHWNLPITNYRITEFQSAVGIHQIKRLDFLNKKRIENAHYLSEKLKGIPGVTLPPEVPYGERVFFYYVIRLDPEVLGSDMLNFSIALASEGTYNLNYLSTTRMMIPQHLEPVFVNKAGYGGTKCPFECPLYEGKVEYYKGLCPVAEKACDEVLWLASVHPLLEKQDLDDIANAVRKVALNFIDKKEKGIAIDYTTDEIRAKL